jgi:hypothetical protein
MKRLILPALMIATLAACSRGDHGTVTGPSGGGTLTATEGRQPNFSTHLSGREAVPPVDTNATGQATLWMSKDEAAIHASVHVTHVVGITGSELRCGAPGTVGGILATLYSGPPISPTGKEARFTSVWLAVTPEMLACLRSGTAYVVVHAASPTQLRGQIR